MTSSATVSVIIPTWNRAHCIEAAVSSALDQTHPPLEVLVCDDGSDDDTQARIRSMADERVRWVSGPRGGRPAIPRNRGIAAAKGEWLAFLDSDDQWLPDKLARQTAVVEASGNRASCTDAWRVVPGHGGRVPLHGGMTGPLTWKMLLTRNKVICSSALVHRSLLKTAEGFPESKDLTALEDYALWLRVSAMTDFDYIAEPLAAYRDDPAHSVRAVGADGWSQRITVLNDFLAWCDRASSCVPKDYVEAARRQLRTARLRRVARKMIGWARTNKAPE